MHKRIPMRDGSLADTTELILPKAPLVLKGNGFSYGHWL